MIRMNIRPPRAIAERKVESVPKVNARIRKSESRNIGSGTRRSMNANATRLRQAIPSRMRTRGLAQPVGWPSAGRMP